MSKNDLRTGPVTDVQKDAPVIPRRQVEIWNGEPPQKDGKKEQIFAIQKECGFNGCKRRLMVERIKNQKFVKDKTRDGTTGGGGQLDYDESDVRQYARCPEHGSLGPTRWA